MPDDSPDPDGFDPLDLQVEARGQRKSLGRLTGLMTRCTRLVWESGRALFVLLVALQLVTAGAMAAQVLVVEQLLAAILELSEGAAGTADLIWPVVALAVLMALTAVSSALQGSLRRYLGEAVARSMWQQVLDVATRVSLRLFEAPSFFDMLQRVQASAVSRPFQVTQSLVGILGAAMASIGVGLTLVAIHPALLLLLLLGGIPLMITSRRESRLEFDFSIAQTPTLRERSYLTFVLTGRPEAKEIRAYDVGPGLRGRFDRLYRRYLVDLGRHLWRRSLLSLVGNLASALLVGVTLLVLVWLIAGGQVSVAQAGAAIVAIRMLQGQVQSLLGSMQTIFESGLFLDDVDRFMRLGPAADQNEVGDPAPAQFSRLRARDVRFRYPESESEALRGVDIEIEPGEIIALVGENGSGKTTLAKILAGLYDATDGLVEWDGRDITTFRRSSLRARVAVIFQDFVKYAFSAEENIALGRHDEPADHDRVAEAARRAGADEFLAALPNGYSTNLSRLFKGGRDLSGGQWQRVAIARAYYRDAPLIILDEPTAALDPRAEHDLFESLRTVLAGRTAVFISHRFSSVRSADRTYVLDQGRIVEHGTHDELMQMGGRYADLFRLQAAAYLRDEAGAHRP